MKQIVPWLWILAIAIVFWLLFVRPASRRQAETAKLQRSIEVGDEVVLTSGVFGRVVELTDDHVGVEIAAGVVIRVLRGAIGSKLDRDAERADDQTDDQTDEGGDTPAAADDTAATADTTDDPDVVDGED